MTRFFEINVFWRRFGYRRRSAEIRQMEYNVTCVCGRSLIVPAGGAGTFRSCECGNQINIPQLSVLRESPAFCIPKAIPIMRSRYHPKNWHIVTWMCVLYWGAWAGLTNWPYKVDPKTAFSVYNEIAVNNNLPLNVSMHGQRGFPSIYSSFLFDSSRIHAETFSLNALISNCFLTGIALASIVILGQSIKNFSIVHLLAITAIIALMLGIYTTIKPGYPVNYWCKVAIFVAPPTILIATTIIRKMQNT
jgi:hypothetical protein